MSDYIIVGIANIFYYFQVKIWFQNRRMKWKRSKKAQQESKMKDGESVNSEKRQSSSHSLQTPPSTIKPSVSQPVEPVVQSNQITNQITSPLEQSQSPRKCPESEPLYRPYVV